MRPKKFLYVPPRSDKAEIYDDIKEAVQHDDVCACLDLFGELVEHTVYEGLTTWEVSGTVTV